MAQIIRQSQFSQGGLAGTIQRNRAMRLANEQTQQQADARQAFLTSMQQGGPTPLQQAVQGPQTGEQTLLQNIGMPMAQQLGTQGLMQSPEFQQLAMSGDPTAQTMFDLIRQTEQDTQKQQLQRATNVNATADVIKQLALEDPDNAEENIRSFLLTQMDTNRTLGLPSDESRTALDTLGTDGVAGVVELADEFQSAVSPFLRGANLSPDNFAKGRSFRVRERDPETGEMRDVIKTQVFDKSTGQSRLVTDPLGGQFISELGETAQEQTQRQIDEKKRIEQEKLIAQEQAKAREAAFEGGERMPELFDILNAMDKVNTGGVNALTLRFKQALGLEDKDEATVLTGLARNVLSQLRPIFGAQFTAKEGEELKRIEASPSKSRAGNIKIIEDILKKVERKIRKERRAAAANGQDFIVSEFDRLLEGLASQRKARQERLNPKRSAANTTVDDIKNINDKAQLEALREQLLKEQAAAAERAAGEGGG